MKKVEISINPLAEFLESTDSRKRKIISEQLDPDPVRVPYYQLARATIRKSTFYSGDHACTAAGILKINDKVAEKPWQKSDKVNSVEALECWKGMHLPEIMENHYLEPVRTKAKYFTLYGVQIKVSPNGIFRVVIDGQRYLGAFKVHISKGKPFNIKQSALVAQMLNQFLSNSVVEEDEIVDPRLCICIDPFSGTIVTASNKIKYDMSQLRNACMEIKKIWDDAGDIGQGVFNELCHLILSLKY